MTGDHVTTRGQHWCLITCDYGPAGGGLASHTFMLAGALAAAGDTVDVWAPPEASAPGIPGVGLHILPSRFGLGALRILRQSLDMLPADTRILLQFVPSRFGGKGRNLLFALLMFTQRKRGIDIYLHELDFPINRRQSPRRNLTALTHMAMIWLVLRAARRVFVAIPGWQRKLRMLGIGPADGRRLVTWIPVPSTLPEQVDPERVRAIRERVAPSAQSYIVGHYGAFGAYHRAVLRPTFEQILDEGADRVVLLIGRGGKRLREAIVIDRPDLASRITVTGTLSPEDASARVAACDVLVQPYHGGVSARRHSLIAALALGRPVVANRGPHTGTFWGHRRAVCLTMSEQPSDLAAAVGVLLADTNWREELSAAARRLHEEIFSLTQTVGRIRKAADADVPAEPELAPESLRHTPPRIMMLQRPARGDDDTARAIHSLSNALVQLGHRVVVAARRTPPADARYEYAPLPASRLALRLNLAPWRGAGDGATDLIHVHAPWWLPLLTRTPSVRTVRATVSESARARLAELPNAIARAARQASRRIARTPQSTVAISGAIATRERFDQVIPDGVDHARYSPGPKSGSARILFRGSWSGSHGGRWLYDLFVEEIAPRHPSAELLLVTDGRVPPHPRVHALPSRDEDALAAAYREAWVFACPHPQGSTSSAMLEAMASGTAVLSLPMPHAVEMLGNGRFGVLAEPTIYADALLRLLADDAMRARVAAAGHARSQEFGWAQVAKRYSALYHTLLGRGSGDGS